MDDLVGVATHCFTVAAENKRLKTKQNKKSVSEAKQKTCHMLNIQINELFSGPILLILNKQ